MEVGTSRREFIGGVSAAALLSGSSKAIEAYWKSVNDAGGINGRKVNFITLDDGYNPAKCVEVVRQLVEQDKVLACFNTLGTPSNTAIQKYMNQRKVPQL